MTMVHCVLCVCNKPYGGDQYDYGSLCVDIVLLISNKMTS